MSWRCVHDGLALGDAYPQLAVLDFDFAEIAIAQDRRNLTPVAFDVAHMLGPVMQDERGGQPKFAPSAFAGLNEDEHRRAPCAKSMPRGMLEFWVDPDSPYYKEHFGHDDKTYVLYCAAAWRSALTAKTLKDMGMTNGKQFADGLKAWKEAGGPVAAREKKDA